MSMQETTPRRPRDVFSPAVDIEEGRDEIVLWADVPGVKEGDLHVTLERNVLTIGASVAPDERDGFRLAHREYGVGDYRRVFTLSDSIDQGRIHATLKDGVLRLALPKAEPARPQRIQVTAG